MRMTVPVVVAMVEYDQPTGRGRDSHAALLEVGIPELEVSAPLLLPMIHEKEHDAQPASESTAPIAVKVCVKGKMAARLGEMKPRSRKERVRNKTAGSCQALQELQEHHAVHFVQKVADARVDTRKLTALKLPKTPSLLLIVTAPKPTVVGARKTPCRFAYNFGRQPIVDDCVPKRARARVRGGRLACRQ